jgi:hypothetical protein
MAVQEVQDEPETVRERHLDAGGFGGDYARTA